MARIAVKDCLEKVFNRFELVVLASKKAKQLFKWQNRFWKPTIWKS